MQEMVEDLDHVSGLEAESVTDDPLQEVQAPMTWIQAALKCSCSGSQDYPVNVISSAPAPKGLETHTTLPTGDVQSMSDTDREADLAWELEMDDTPAGKPAPQSLDVPQHQHMTCANQDVSTATLPQCLMWSQDWTPAPLTSPSSTLGIIHLYS
jgi:hypothetical protein